MDNNINPLKMYTEKEAANVLSVSLHYLKQMAVKGDIQYVAWGTQRRYPHFYLEEWLREMLNKSRG